MSLAANNIVSAGTQVLAGAWWWTRTDGLPD